MENRIQINGVWYVAEKDIIEPDTLTVDWLIGRLKELSELGMGKARISLDVDHGMDWDFLENVETIEMDGLVRVHLS